MLICANALRIPLADESVQCIVTSPPYWGLRKYAGEQEFIWDEKKKCRHRWNEHSETKELRTGTGMAKLGESYRGGGKKIGKIQELRIESGICMKCGAWRGAFGLEPTIEMYVDHTIQILRELRRVLRDDGVLFWNIGDSYCSGAYSPRIRENPKTTHARENRINNHTPQNWTIQANKIPRNGRPPGLKPKDLVLMPARVALAAQADGWWVRSMIIWAKPNPMPESVTDRPTDTYEHIIMLAKSDRYFWDADAVREPAEWDKWGAQTNLKDLVGGASLGVARTKEEIQMIARRSFGSIPKGTNSRGTGDGGPKAEQRGSYQNWAESTREVLGSRNMRNLWMFATQPYSGAHFATFPEELPRRCILGATSEFGACRFCGAPWKRAIKASGGTIGQDWNKNPDRKETNDKTFGHRAITTMKEADADGSYQRNTIGWMPTCKCKGQHRKVVPCVVLDPFGGSGTTGRVALELNRTPVLLDVAYNPAAKEHYADLAKDRTSEVQPNLKGMFI